jgi:hypothetical protein
MKMTELPKSAREFQMAKKLSVFGQSNGAILSCKSENISFFLAQNFLIVALIQKIIESQS